MLSELNDKDTLLIKIDPFFFLGHRQWQRRDPDWEDNWSDHRCGLLSGHGWKDKTFSDSGFSDIIHNYKKWLFLILSPISNN